MKKPAKASIEVRGTVVNIVTQNETDYICLTDIARFLQTIIYPEIVATLPLASDSRQFQDRCLGNPGEVDDLGGFLFADTDEVLSQQFCDDLSERFAAVLGFVLGTAGSDEALVRAMIQTLEAFHALNPLVTVVVDVRGRREVEIERSQSSGTLASPGRDGSRWWRNRRCEWNSE